MRPLRTQTQISGQGESATTHPEPFPALPASDVTLSTREPPGSAPTPRCWVNSLAAQILEKQECSLIPFPPPGSPSPEME